MAAGVRSRKSRRERCWEREGPDAPNGFGTTAEGLLFSPEPVPLVAGAGAAPGAAGDALLGLELELDPLLPEPWACTATGKATVRMRRTSAFIPLQRSAGC